MTKPKHQSVNPYKSPILKEEKPCSCRMSGRNDISEVDSFIFLITLVFMFGVFSVWYNKVSIHIIKDGHVIEKFSLND